MHKCSSIPLFCFQIWYFRTIFGMIFGSFLGVFINYRTFFGKCKTIFVKIWDSFWKNGDDSSGFLDEFWEFADEICLNRFLIGKIGCSVYANFLSLWIKFLKIVVSWFWIQRWIFISNLELNHNRHISDNHYNSLWE